MLGRVFRYVCLSCFRVRVYVDDAAAIENQGFWIKLQNCLSKDLIDKVKPKNKKETQVEE